VKEVSSFHISYRGKIKLVSGDIRIKKPVANAVPESEKKNKKIQTNE